MTYLNGLGELRAHLVDTLVELGRSPEGAARQVADFEHAVRLAAIEETAHQARRTAQKQLKGKGH